MDRRTADRAPSKSRTTSNAAATSIGVESARDHELARLAVLQHALEHTTAVVLSYHRPDEDAATTRRVRPYAMVRADANIYLVGFCERAQGMRVFRLDRVVGAESTAETFVIPESFPVESVLQQGHVFSQDDAVNEQLVVRYAPAVARWIAEREQVPLEPDGSVLVQYPLADAAWAVRHVLQYGPDAVILSPASVRADVETALRAMLG